MYLKEGFLKKTFFPVISWGQCQKTFMAGRVCLSYAVSSPNVIRPNGVRLSVVGLNGTRQSVVRPNEWAQ